MLNVDIVRFEDLTEDEKEMQPDNGCGKEYANYIKLTNESKTVMILSDAVEPEDATFSRDFSEVLEAIKIAYNTGLSDGLKSKKSEIWGDKTWELKKPFILYVWRWVV